MSETKQPISWLVALRIVIAVLSAISEVLKKSETE
jgi:hypothetical protein